MFDIIIVVVTELSTGQVGIFVLVPGLFYNSAWYLLGAS